MLTAPPSLHSFFHTCAASHRNGPIAPARCSAAVVCCVPSEFLLLCRGASSSSPLPRCRAMEGRREGAPYAAGNRLRNNAASTLPPLLLLPPYFLFPSVCAAVKLFLALFYLGPSRSCFSNETDADAMRRKKTKRGEERRGDGERGTPSLPRSGNCAQPSVSRDSAPIILSLVPVFFPLPASPPSSIHPAPHSPLPLAFAAVFNRDQEVLAPLLVLLVRREERRRCQRDCPAVAAQC